MLSNIIQEANSAFSSDEYVWHYRRRKDGCTHLKVRRRDKEPVMGWDILQAIKNYTFGKEKVGIEIYPKESKLINEVNMRHLYILTQEQLSILDMKGI